MKKYEGELNRTMEFDGEQDYEVGGIYSLGMHWAMPDASSQDFLEGKKYTYNFHCKNASGMAFDYDNMTEDEMHEYDTNEDAWQECEVIVDENQKFEIISIEGGYYEELDGYIYDVEVKIA